MLCPLDQLPLKQHPVGAYTALRCESCSGTFVPGHVFREIRAKAALEVHNRKSDGIEASVQHRAKINCLHDENPMMSLTFKDIEIDVCSQCFGIWLDHGELKKVIAYVGAPRKADLSNAGAHLGSLSTSNNLQLADISGLGDILEIVSDICSVIPQI